MRASRFSLAAFLLVLMFGAAPAVAQSDPLVDQWGIYRDRFVGDDGRVRDTGNKEVSHTEGQGTAMLLAATLDDRATFDRVWQWTRDKLRRPEGALFAWRWDPTHAENPVSDTNNASDGDIMIAWALSVAAQRWHEAEYRSEARRMIAELRTKLLQRVGGQLVLMPGTDGFKEKDGVVILNPSYYIYPAFREFATLDPSPSWARLRRDGLALLAKAQFGQWALPTDWIAVSKSGGLSPAAGIPPRFGFDAIRVPLYLVWSGAATPQRLAAMVKYWGSFADKPIPAWVDVTNGQFAPFAAPSGFLAVIQLAEQRRDPKPAPLPQIGDKDDYYSASLILLADLARRSLGK
jgi:endoglucanase